MLESFKTDIVKKVATLTGINKAIVELNPWLRYQFLVHKGIQNMVYYVNPANEHGKVNLLTASNTLEDKDLLLLKYYKTPMIETQTKAFSQRLQKACSDTRILYLDKCIFLATIEDVDILSKKVFILDEKGAPQKDHVHFLDADLKKWETAALFILQMKTAFAYDDKAVRPFILVDTAGQYTFESDFRKVWLAFIAVEKI